jgi:hypothetical protein
MKWLLAIAVIGVVLLHQDSWLWRDHSLVAGFLPVGLAYHVGYCLVASALMWTLTRYLWPAELEEVEQPGVGVPVGGEARR